METSQIDLVRVGPATTVSLRRLGALLRATRVGRGVELARLAEVSGDMFSSTDLADIEDGRASLTDDEVDDLLALYDAEPGDLLASRSTLVIDLHEGTVAAGPWSTTFRPDADGTDDVLARYLALVYEMRNLAPGATIPLRTLDVSVLSTALALPADEIEGRLVVLMEPGNRRLAGMRSLLRARVLVPAAGIVVAATAVGVLVMVSGSEAAPGTEVGRSVASVVGDNSVEVAPPGADVPEIGDGLTIERQGVEVAPPGADEPEIGDGLTIER